MAETTWPRAVIGRRIQEFRSSGVQEFRSSGVQEFRSSGVQELKQACWISAIASQAFLLRFFDENVEWSVFCNFSPVTQDKPKDSATPELLQLLQLLISTFVTKMRSERLHPVTI
jgi:hypothetical protein